MAGGYNHKLPVLLELLVAKAANFTVNPERFAVVKESLTKDYANVLFGQPYQWAMNRAEVRPPAPFNPPDLLPAPSANWNARRRALHRVVVVVVVGGGLLASQ